MTFAVVTAVRSDENDENDENGGGINLSDKSNGSPTSAAALAWALVVALYVAIS